MNWNKDYILELKSDESSAPMIEDNTNEKYKIKILHRGEQLFYYDKSIDKALIIEIQVRNGSLFKKSITKWDTGEKITEDESKIILSRIKKYFKNYQKIETIVR